MSQKLAPDDLKKLELLWTHLRQLENDWGHSGTETPFLTTAKIDNLKKEFLQFEASELFELKKISEIHKHLKPELSLRQFTPFLLPIERLLNKNLIDQDFLIQSEDKIQTQRKTYPVILVLDNIRSSFNVGSILRSAECLGAENVYLCGYTPSPENSKTSKAAMGVESYIPWQSSPNAMQTLQDLKVRGYRIIALETTTEATELYTEFSKNPCAFVLGNERFGLGPEILQICDEVRKIPLVGVKNSLNVGVSAAIALSEWKRQYER